MPEFEVNDSVEVLNLNEPPSSFFHVVYRGYVSSRRQDETGAWHYTVREYYTRGFVWEYPANELRPNSVVKELGLK